MARRLALLSVLTLLIAGTAAAEPLEDIGEQQAELAERIAQLREKIARADRKEEVLTTEISFVTSKIRALEDEVLAATAKLDSIEADLTVYRNRLAELTQLYRLQTDNLNRLKRQYTVAERRVNRRLVAIYQEEDPSTIDVVLSARSFGDMLDQLDYLSNISRQDQAIARQVADAKAEVAQARRKTNGVRKRVSAAARDLEASLEQQFAERNRLVAAQDELEGARAAKRETLGAVQVSKEEFLHEVAGLEQASAELAARIQAAQSSSTVSAPSAQGFVWPVAGTVTSGFGWRWGRMHEGIDIAAPTGAPIVSSAAGVVIFAGWMSGYGQLVVVDHGGGLATAYAHMSSIASAPGQAVGQGQVLGYVGCTGNCTGPHVHFEVRVNGAAADPLGYL